MLRSFPRLGELARLGALASLVVAGCSVRTFVSPHAPRHASDAPPGAGAPADGELVVVTFNVQRAERIDAAIAQLSRDATLREADILLLQEMDAAGARAIAAAMRMGYVYYPSYVQGDRESGTAVASRYPIVSDRAILLPHPNPIDGRRRRATRAVVDAPGGPLLVYSVHALPMIMSIRGRRAQARHVLDDAARFDLPAIIGGDFNTAERASVRRVVWDYRLLGFDWATRDIEATADYFFGSLVLDHVFVRGLTVLGAGAPRTEASDHRPVWVRIRTET